MRIPVIALCLFLFQSAFAQKVIDVSKQDVQIGPDLVYSVAGVPFVTAKFVNVVSGSAYFKDAWLKGVATGTDNQRYKPVNMKLDLVDKEVHYQDQSGKEYIVTVPLKQVVLSDDSGNQYRFVHASTLPKSNTVVRDSWYQLLDSGTASLYKFIRKDLLESIPYGSATTEERIVSVEKYYVLHDNSFTEIKKIKDVPSVLSNKKKELEAYLKSKDDGQATTEDRLKNIIDYYNSLAK